MRFIPSFVYGLDLAEDFTELVMTLPQKWWTPEEGALGSEAITQSGIPVGTVDRYEQAVGVSARFTDDEFVAFMTMVEFLLRNKSLPLLLRLDVENAASEYSVYLEKPGAGDRVQPVRDAGDFSVWTIDLSFRTIDGSRIHLGLFDEVVGS